MNSTCLTPLSYLCSITQSCPTLCNPMGCSPPGSSVLGILQATILERVVLPSSKRSSPHRDRTCISCLAAGFFTTAHPEKPCPTWLPPNSAFFHRYVGLFPSLFKRPHRQYAKHLIFPSCLDPTKENAATLVNWFHWVFDKDLPFDKDLFCTKSTWWHKS